MVLISSSEWFQFDLIALGLMICSVQAYKFHETPDGPLKGWVWSKVHQRRDIIEIKAIAKPYQCHFIFPLPTSEYKSVWHQEARPLIELICQLSLEMHWLHCRCMVTPHVFLFWYSCVGRIYQSCLVCGGRKVLITIMVIILWRSRWVIVLAQIVAMLAWVDDEKQGHEAAENVATIV